MSLAVLANDMASRGRGQDSMLVHMTPHEVAGLQALAMKHGGSLTINPDTGLPEAGFLSSILPALAGFALNAFAPGLGTAVGGMFGLGAAAGTGIAVGGLTALASGSLSRGLMAGMGAYGGAGLSEGLMGAGASAGAGQTLAAEAAANAAQEGITLPSNYAEMAAKTATPDQIAAARAASTPGDLLSAGAKSAGADPTGFLKSNWKPLAAAAGPIMADMMVPTTTKMPENKNPAYIRQYVTGDRPQAPRALAPVLASEWGSRSFQDAYAKPMATGGIVALAEGGTPPPTLTDEQLYQKTGSWEAAAAARDEQNRALNEYNNQLAAQYVKTAAVPTETAQQFISGAEQAGIGLTAPLQAALGSSGLSAAAQYALTHADIGPTANAAETYGGLKGLSSNINYLAGGLQNQITAGAKTGQQAREEALMEMNKYGLNEADIKRATGKTLAELFPNTTIKPVTVVNPITGVASAAGPTTGTVLPTTPMTNAPAGTSNPYGNVNNPGDLTFNPDGTITVQPNLPGRPYGGYSGITELTNAYTAGGGSTGYVSPVVKTAAEHDKLYNKQTGDSLEAYNYLIGKGGAKYPTKSGVSEIMKPYEEAVLGYPTDLTKKKYINVNGKMVLNPEYKAPQTQAQKTAAATAAAKAGKADTIYVTNNRGETEAATLGDDGNYRTSGGETYDVSGKQVVAQGGMMGYSVGGGLGSLGSYSDGGRLLKGPGDGVSDSIPATIGRKQQPARLADGEFVVPARIVSELGNGSTDAGAKKLYAMMDRVQRARGKTTGKNKVAANSRADKYLPA